MRYVIDTVRELLTTSVARLNPRRSGAAGRPHLAAGGRTHEFAPWVHLAALSSEGVLVLDLAKPNMPLVYVNAAFEHITGYSAHEAVGKSPRHLWGRDHSQPEIATLVEALRNREEAQVTLRNYRKDGSLFWIELRVAPIFDRHHRATHYFGVMRDVTDKQSPVAHVNGTASRDPVTGLLDRTGYDPQLQALIDASGDSAFLLMKADVIDFHELNTSFGYHMGDALLQEIADRLRRLPGALIGRIGADEFVIGLCLPDPAAAKAIVEEMQDALEAPYTLPIALLNVRFAIGYAIGPKQHPAVRLMREGSFALRKAQRLGGRVLGGRVIEYDQTTHVKLQARRRLTGQLQQAIAKQQFRLEFQPKVELATGRLVGGQGFLRWHHPVLGDRGTGELLSLAEKTGLIVQMSEWAMNNLAAFTARCNQGLEQAAADCLQGPGHGPRARRWAPSFAGDGPRVRS